MKQLSIYVHVPFCVKKCLYCDFLSFNEGPELIDRYFGALIKEIEACADKFRDYEIKSVFFGGGTPSFVDSRLICDTLGAIAGNFRIRSDAEISIEVNPASAIYGKLCNYRQAGFNRISIGAQSLNDSELVAIGRAHDKKAFYETFENARKAGFNNINVDVMSALPGQSLDSYMDTLKKVVSLRPEHISAYSLIIEEGTPFYDMKLDLPSEEVDRAMYHETKRFLEEHRYHRYEISNYALGRDHECSHNKVYWTRGEYLGLGIGAASMVDNRRWSNTRNVEDYIQNSTNPGSVRENVEELDVKAQMEEFMFLGLRLVEGISISEFERQFGKDIFAVYGDVISRYREMGLLELQKGWLRLTDKGLDVSNTVMADFLL